MLPLIIDQAIRPVIAVVTSTGNRPLWPRGESEAEKGRSECRNIGIGGHVLNRRPERGRLNVRF